ncbi:MAG: hypothetical protein JWR19_4056 [Pedosphaera sp.]|nr:hypothetical protein [Pedosphaera sp.]
MNRDQMKLISSAYRLNEADPHDVLFRDAPSGIQHDSLLQNSIQEQQQIDAVLHFKLRQIPIPAGLQKEILTCLGLKGASQVKSPLEVRLGINFP